MYSARLEKAFELADKCWEKAYNIEPIFVEKYLALAEKLLEERHTVTGDLFRAYCTDNGLKRPPRLHPNVWVSGVRVVNQLVWMEPVTKVEPKEGHNHMNTVTLWRSTIYRGAENA